MKIFFIVILLSITACTKSGKDIEKIKTKAPFENKFFGEIKFTEREAVLGESSTPLLDQGANRVNNIKIACEKINGIEIKEGETFSFNEATGERNIKNGYKNAPVIVDGEKSYGIGGGVCQVSTAIYLASLDAGLGIAEHHNHSESVAYAPNGKDATVVYGVKDLKIKNNTRNPICIYAWTENEKVFAKIIKKVLTYSNYDGNIKTKDNDNHYRY